MEANGIETPRERLRIFARTDWQMPLGERAVLEGVLAQLSPALAIEIGSAQGGSLERIAEHSAAVHALDLTSAGIAEIPGNVTFHEGDSRVMLPPLLAELAEQGRTVDFALVDGDHSREGVRADLEALLDSPACRGAVVLLHDSYNPAVRAGVADAVAEREEVVDFDLDFVPGRRFAAGPLRGQLWGGFAIVLAGPAELTRPLPAIAGRIEGLDPIEYDFEDSHELVRAADARTGRGTTEVAALREQLVAIQESASWRLTAPLRALKRLRRGSR